MYEKPQRPAAPWAMHNWWGKFTTAATLPNTAGSDIQVTDDELQVGDVAWANDVGALFVCTDTTPGAAAWERIPVQQQGINPVLIAAGALQGSTGNLFPNSQNIASIVRTSAGRYTVTLADNSLANIATTGVFLTLDASPTPEFVAMIGDNIATTGEFEIRINDLTGTPADVPTIYFMVWNWNVGTTP